MSRPRIIGLTGKKRVGKGEVACILSSYTTLSFAKGIRAKVYAMGVTPDEMADKETIIPRLKASPRKLMQDVGDWGRAIDIDYWVKIARAEMEPLLAMNIGIVFDDIRHDNEAEMIRSLGGPIWEVRRFLPDSDDHASERGIGKHLVTHIIANEGTRESLRRAVTKLVGFEQGIVTT